MKKSLLNKIFSCTKFGSIQITTPENEKFEFAGKNPGPNASMIIRDWRLIDAIVLDQDVGIFEAYVENLWDTESIETLQSFVFRNEKEFHKADIGVMDGIKIWSQSKKVHFKPKKPLSEYQLKFKYSIPDEFSQKRILLLGKNNTHLSDLANVTIHQHDINYEPFDLIMIYDPLFYVKNVNVFLQKMKSLIKPDGKMLWRTLLFLDPTLTQGKFLDKLAFPGFWAPRPDETHNKLNQFFDITDQTSVDYPGAAIDDRLFKIFHATAVALIKENRLNYKEFALSPKTLF